MDVGLEGSQLDQLNASLSTSIPLCISADKTPRTSERELMPGQSTCLETTPDSSFASLVNLASFRFVEVEHGRGHSGLIHMLISQILILDKPPTATNLHHGDPIDLTYHRLDVVLSRIFWRSTFQKGELPGHGVVRLSEMEECRYLDCRLYATIVVTHVTSLQTETLFPSEVALADLPGS
ncbi:hypothetical protein JAAARDRAFT_196537 [Jaapia argillacea MUCL 33604]|uniref:Uncharacterized protein n=1 Tax=Jaapia argillacea MUCL 33604 TaxID=933084 RepID=A0A067PI96_9AGAM|nr:hypothetical protein JAAARDRAFT_196537 [Jaapia argillacea MUCL 33604]